MTTYPMITLMIGADADPVAHMTGTTRNIPLLDLVGPSSYSNGRYVLQFKTDPATVTYLTTLAAQAAELADQVQTFLDTGRAAA